MFGHAEIPLDTDCLASLIFILGPSQGYLVIAHISEIAVCTKTSIIFLQIIHILVTLVVGHATDGLKRIMASINVLLTTFAGLNLPPTLCLPLPKHSSVASLFNTVGDLLPAGIANDAVSLSSNGRSLLPSSKTLATLVSCDGDERETANFLTISLNARLRGGKGGFGSQLRAAGGRMSSRKRKQNAELATGSARNLDGRRLRTITEAKNLATYLATKPDMDRKEKEEKRKRWEAIVELAEQREADMKAGKTADGRRKGLSSEWLEEKEEVGENVKNAVKMAMAASTQKPEKDESSGSGGSVQASADEDSDEEEPMELDEPDMNRLRMEAEAGDVDAIWVLENKLKIPKDLLPKPKAKAPRFAGFDDDDSSDSESEEEVQQKAKSKDEA